MNKAMRAKRNRLQLIILIFEHRYQFIEFNEEKHYEFAGMLAIELHIKEVQIKKGPAAHSRWRRSNRKLKTV